MNDSSEAVPLMPSKDVPATDPVVKNHIESSQFSHGMAETHRPEVWQQAGRFIRNLSNELQKHFLGQDTSIQQIIIILLADGHAILSGPSGSGKHTLFKILARTLDAKVHEELSMSSESAHDVSDSTGIHWALWDECCIAPSENINNSLHQFMMRYRQAPNVNCFALMNAFDLFHAQTSAMHYADHWMGSITLAYLHDDFETHLIQRLSKLPSRKSMETRLIKKVLQPKELHILQKMALEVHIHPDVAAYVTQLSRAIRQHAKIARPITSKALTSLLKLAKAQALFLSRAYVTPDDVKHVFALALTHRLILTPSALLSGIQVTDILEDVLNHTPVPHVSSL